MKHGFKWRTGERLFRQRVYKILCDFKEGKIKGNGTAVGQLDQPLTGVADAIQAAIEEDVVSWAARKSP
jgi:hypothetical protein